MAEFHPVAVVLLSERPRREATGELVLGDPDLIGAVAQVHRVDQLELRGDVLPDGQPRRRVGLRRDQARLQAHAGETERFPGAERELLAGLAGQQRERLLLRHLQLRALDVLELSAGDEQ